MESCKVKRSRDLICMICNQTITNCNCCGNKFLPKEGGLNEIYCDFKNNKNHYCKNCYENCLPEMDITCDKCGKWCAKHDIKDVAVVVISESPQLKSRRVTNRHLCNDCFKLFEKEIIKWVRKK